MAEQDNKVPGMTPELLGLIHPELAGISQMKSLAPSEQRMLWQVPDSKWEDMNTALRCLGHGKQRAQLPLQALHVHLDKNRGFGVVCGVTSGQAGAM